MSFPVELLTLVITPPSVTLVNVSTLSGSQPQVAGSHRVASRQSPGLVLQTFEEATESTSQQTYSAQALCTLQNTLLALSRLLSQFYQVLRRLGPLPRFYRRL